MFTGFHFGHHIIHADNFIEYSFYNKEAFVQKYAKVKDIFACTINSEKESHKLNWFNTYLAIFAGSSFIPLGWNSFDVTKWISMVQDPTSRGLLLYNNWIRNEWCKQKAIVD